MLMKIVVFVRMGKLLQLSPSFLLKILQNYSDHSFGCLVINAQASLSLINNPTDSQISRKIFDRFSHLSQEKIEARRKPRKIMEPELEKRVDKVVRKILEESNMDEVTEHKIRKQASAELELDLSKPPFKAFVRKVVDAFLQEQNQQEEDEEEENQPAVADAQFDDEGNLIICKLSEKRKVTIQDFRGKTLVSIREYFKKDGKELPTSKGISLTEEQWSAFNKNVPAIEKAIKKMESKIM